MPVYHFSATPPPVYATIFMIINVILSLSMIIGAIMFIIYVIRNFRRINKLEEKINEILDIIKKDKL